MKPGLFIGAVALLFMVSCNNADKKAPLSMTGAYKMLSITMKNAGMDTTSTSQQQMKIYTNDHMIYAWVNEPDSTAGFGIGSYETAGDSVMESVFFSAGDSSLVDSLRHYTLHITKASNGGYTQTIDSIGTPGSMINLTEVYDSVGNTTSSPLDGAWKLKEVYWIDNKGDSTKQERVQYKVYNAGNTIWGNSYKDSAGKMNTLVGYGTFTMTGDTLCRENMIESNISAVRGNSFDLKIELMGTDSFKQTITGTDGSTVEIYERLKK